MPTHAFPTLHDHQGRFWKIYITVDKSGRGFIGKEFGIKGGKVSRPKPREIKYKTTPSSQEMYNKLYKLAETKWKNKNRTGFNTNVPKIGAITPMLAYDYTKYSHRITFPAYVQIKYDGYRALTDMSRHILLSRRMNELPNVAHITKELAKIGAGDGVYLDGELYLPEGIFELKSTLSGKTKLKPTYYVFDMFDINQMEMGFEERWKRLQKLLKGHKFKYIKLVETMKVKNDANIHQHLAKFIKAGYEGLVVRNAAGPYKLRGRSMDVQKLVEIKRGYFTIVGYRAAEGEQVVWELKCQKSKRTFCASPMGTHEYRRQLLKNAPQYIGKKVLVKYFDIDGEGCVTRNPVVVMYGRIA